MDTVDIECRQQFSIWRTSNVTEFSSHTMRRASQAHTHMRARNVSQLKGSDTHTTRTIHASHNSAQCPWKIFYRRYFAFLIHYGFSIGVVWQHFVLPPQQNSVFALSCESRIKKRGTNLGKFVEKKQASPLERATDGNEKQKIKLKKWVQVDSRPSRTD